MGLSKYAKQYNPTKENMLITRKPGVTEKGVFSMNHEFETRFLYLWIYQSVKEGWEYLITPKTDEIPLTNKQLQDIFKKDPPNMGEQGFITYHNSYIRCIIKASELEDLIVEYINEH